MMHGPGPMTAALAYVMKRPWLWPLILIEVWVWKHRRR